MIRPYKLDTIAFARLSAVDLSPRDQAHYRKGKTRMPHKVGCRSLYFEDPSRRAWDGDRPRPLLTDIWYPAMPDAIETDQFIGPPDTPLFKIGKVATNVPMLDTSDPFPLILLSHGTGGSTKQHSWLAYHLAAHGYVVAGVNHHGNNALEPYVAEGFLRFWERPRDLTVMLDHLLQTPDFGPHIDQTRIGAAGFSLGGYTVIALAGGRASFAAFQAAFAQMGVDAAAMMPPEFTDTQAWAEAFQWVASDTSHQASYQDERVKAVFAIAPALAQAFTADGLAPVTIPVALVVGDDDTPPFTDAAHYAKLIPQAEFEVLGGHVGHYTFLAEGTLVGRQMLPQLCNDALGVDRRAVHERVAEKARVFFEGALGG